MSIQQLSPHQILELRKFCLELAIKAGAGFPVEAAGRFYAFIVDNGQKTPRERILQVLDDAGVR